MTVQAIAEVRRHGEARLTMANLERSPVTARAKQRSKPTHDARVLRDAARRAEHGFWRHNLPTL